MIKFDPHWFGVRLGDRMVHIGQQSVIFCAAQVFNRRFVNDEHCWGVGVLQVGRRYLLYIGHSGVSILFIGRI
jgi:hypothetical protein